MPFDISLHALQIEVLILLRVNFDGTCRLSYVNPFCVIDLLHLRIFQNFRKNSYLYKNYLLYTIYYTWIILYTVSRYHLNHLLLCIMYNNTL